MNTFEFDDDINSDNTKEENKKIFWNKISKIKYQTFLFLISTLTCFGILILLLALNSLQYKLKKIMDMYASEISMYASEISIISEKLERGPVNQSFLNL